MDVSSGHLHHGARHARNDAGAARPAAAHKLCCSEGEVATARAAAAAGTIMILSTVSTTSMEEVAAAAGGPRWFQLYAQDREVTRTLVQRAEAGGYTALCLTVDVPVIGNRERDLRNSFSSRRSTRWPTSPASNRKGCAWSTYRRGVRLGPGSLHRLQVGPFALLERRKLAGLSSPNCPWCSRASSPPKTPAWPPSTGRTP